MPTTIADQILFARKKVGWLQKDLADWLNVSLITLIRWEKGYSWPAHSVHQKKLELFVGEPLIWKTGEQIKKERVKAGWSARDLAWWLDVDYRSVIKWESTGQPPQIKDIRRRLDFFLQF